MFDYSRKPVKWQVGNFSEVIYLNNQANEKEKIFSYYIQLF